MKFFTNFQSNHKKIIFRGRVYLHAVLGIRILTDLHQSEQPDPAADQHQSRIKVKVLWLWSLKWGHGGSWRLEGSKWSRVWWSYRVSRPVHGRRFVSLWWRAGSGSASQREEIRINVMRRNTAYVCVYGAGFEKNSVKLSSLCYLSVFFKSLESIYAFEMYFCGYWSMLIPWVGCTRMKTERGRSRPWEMGSTLFFSLPLCSPSPSLPTCRNFGRSIQISSRKKISERCLWTYNNPNQGVSCIMYKNWQNCILEVPSHQIRSAWKWYSWRDFHLI